MSSARPPPARTERIETPSAPPQSYTDWFAPLYHMIEQSRPRNETEVMIRRSLLEKLDTLRRYDIARAHLHEYSRYELQRFYDMAAGYQADKAFTGYNPSQSQPARTPTPPPYLPIGPLAPLQTIESEQPGLLPEWSQEELILPLTTDNIFEDEL